jgi:hypothetical protein
MTEPEGACPDCGTQIGQLHDRGCLKERCPFCLGQLPLCDCIYDVLALNLEEREVVEEYIDDMEEPLHGIMMRWHSALERKGRIPFGSEP